MRTMAASMRSYILRVCVCVCMHTYVFNMYILYIYIYILLYIIIIIIRGIGGSMRCVLCVIMMCGYVIGMCVF